MNEYDSSKIEDILTSTNNYSVTNIAEEADVLLLNTCSIREKAQEKVFHQLGRWKTLKKNKPKLIIGIGGCVAAQEGKNIYKRANYVDIIFGPQTLHRLPKMLTQVKTNLSKPIIDISFPMIEKFDYFPEPQMKACSAFVSIMEGCDKYCSYCIVPYTRGQEISRSCDDILFEVAQLAEQGVREVNLLGQNVNAYHDKNFDNGVCQFDELIRLIATIDGIDRIRFTTSHPEHFTSDIIHVYHDIPKLVSFLHLPVQSGSDRILKLMKRSYTVKEYKNIINNLIQVRPNIQISSDFIVGFPGETNLDFENTIQFIKEINFDMSFSFIYSKRPGTPAANLKDTVSLQEKKERLHILQHVIQNQALKWTRKMLGTTQSILVESISKKNIMKLSGRTENNRIVHFEGNPEMIGKFVNVKIIDIYGQCLHGVLINKIFK